MNNQIQDPQLEYELQDLYISSKHWLSDMAFATDEIRFFKLICDKYFLHADKNEQSTQLRAFRRTISEKEVETFALKRRVMAYLNFLQCFIADAERAIGFDLIERHTLLESEVKELFVSLKILKSTLFLVVEKLT